MIEPVPAPAQPAGAPAELRDAGQAFEALILHQMLGSIVPADMPGSSLATQALARTLSDASPFGIAALLESRR